MLVSKTMISGDQVTALAPDAASFKAGKALAVNSKWTDLGRNDQMIWGLAKGSGSKPYYTQVDAVEFAYKCSCPSRKFPCKHALGLMFLAADDLTVLPESSLPDWVKAWVDGRKEKQGQKVAASAKKASAKPKNKDTAAKTRKKRESRVEEGVSFLQDFLLDLIRQGLGQVDLRNRSHWDNVSRRLIDCQAPGLAAAVARVGDLRAVDDTRLLHEIGSLYMLTHSCANKNRLNEAQQAEVDQRIGWQVAKESVLENKPITDDWFVAFRTVAKPAQVTVYSTWVTGRTSNQWALILSFSAAGSAPAALWPVGGTVTTALAFYPGAGPERALPVDETVSANMELPCSAAPETVSGMLNRAAGSLAVNPWRTRLPFLLNAQPTTIGDQSVLVDTKGLALPWRAVGSQQLILSTVCGGNPSLVAGEWDGYQCHLHAADDSGSWFALRDQFA